jgi:uncharacterized protein YlxW (UPF0749 family)
MNIVAVAATIAEIPTVAKWIVAALTAIVGFLINRLITKNDNAHAESKEQISKLATIIRELESKYEIHANDISDLKNNISEIGGIGDELKRAFDIDQEIKRREEQEGLKAIKELAEATLHDGKK